MIYAKYTVVLKTLLDNEETKEQINKAMSTYPIYNPIHEQLYAFVPTREMLNKKILDHYKYHEIGFETVGRFTDEMEIALNEIMPLYNQEFKSIDVMNGVEDIFGNLDVTETFEQESEGSSSGSANGTSGTNTTTSSSTESNSSSETTSTTENHSKNVEATTPQGNILSLNNKQIDNVTHADKINWNHNESNDSATNTGMDSTSGESTVEVTGNSSEQSSSERTDKTKHTLTRKGNQGVNTYAHDMLEFRKLFQNIEQRIIKDERISDLFMHVY